MATKKKKKKPGEEEPARRPKSVPGTPYESRMVDEKTLRKRMNGKMVRAHG